MTIESGSVPFYRPDLGEAEIAEVEAVLRSGWLTTGSRVRRFEKDFAAAVGARYAVALNSATAALHLAVESLGLERGVGVLVPTMTFAATAEIVRYFDAVPILVDCDPVTLNIDWTDATAKLATARTGQLGSFACRDVVGILPVHVGGLMVDVARMRAFAEEHRLWIVEDAAHAFPAAWRPHADADWVRCGERTASVSCFSFYANKTITTGEGGMAVTDDASLAERMRLMSLHGLSNDAWTRYSGGHNWDYQIVAPGFKYNLTDIAAAIGIHQLARAEDMRRRREAIASGYRERLASIEAIELPPDVPDRMHAWHLFAIRLCLERLTIDRAAFVAELQSAGIGCSVHWRPLHLHRYYREHYGWTEEECPVASREWPRLISLPIFPSMMPHEQDRVAAVVEQICLKYKR